MNYLVSRLVLVAAIQLVAGSALAQTIRPGLWQIDSKITSANTETDQAMAVLFRQMGNLPPDQRKMLEQLAAQQGMAMPTIGADGAIGTRSCITPEMAARKLIPTGQQGTCTSNNVAVNGGMKLSFSCTNPPSSGEGKLIFSGDTAFNMAVNVTTSARGAPEQMTVTSAGKWLSAACPATLR